MEKSQVHLFSDHGNNNQVKTTKSKTKLTEMHKAKLDLLSVPQKCHYKKYSRDLPKHIDSVVQYLLYMKKIMHSILRISH